MNTKPKKISVIILSLILLASLAALSYTSKIPHIFWCHIYGGMTDELKDSSLYTDMESGSSFCFIGDSITYGTLTNGVGWYAPLERYIKGDVYEYAYGRWTTDNIISGLEDIPVADIYVIAVGVNDVIITGISPEEYAANMETITEGILSSNPGSKFYFIAPWPAFNASEETNNGLQELSEALADFCSTSDCVFIDPCGIIRSVIAEEGYDTYMYDWVHPNVNKGIGLYSYSVLYADHMNSSAA